MKKFLLYVVVIVSLLFLGFTVYYLVKNDEKIALTINEGETIYLNEEESYSLPLKWTKPSRGTKLTVEGADGEIVKYDTDTKMFTAKNGGVANITIRTSNAHFGPFHLTISVCDGEANSPYVVRTAEELAGIGKDAKHTSSKYYVLDRDLDLSTYNNGFWIPLGDFSGHFNGNGHTLYNLKIASGNYAGLFERITKNGVVENVKFARVDLNGDYTYVGAVAGINNGTIGKVDVSGSVSNAKVDGYTGLIAGANKWDASQAYINMCSAKGNVVSAYYAGGIAGLNYASVILNSRAVLTGIQETAEYSYAGGLVGLNSAYYDEDNVAYYPSAIIKSYAIVDNAQGQVGAVIGAEWENSSNSLWYNKFDGIYYSAQSGVEAIVNVSGYYTNNQLNNISLVTKDALLNKETYVDYDFDNVWLKEQTDYATLNYDGTYENIFIVGLKKTADIQNTDDLADIIDAIKEDPQNDTVINIDENLVWDLDGAEWTTIAPNKDNPLKASFIVAEGKTLTIKNFKLSGENSSFFGYIGGTAKISGIVFEDVTINNETSESAIVATGIIDSASIENITVKNIAAFTTKATTIGIVCAEIQGTNIKNCKVENEDLTNVTVYANAGKLVVFGGIVGKNYGTVKECTVNNIKLQTSTSISRYGRFDIGGIAGITNGIVSNCGVDTFTLTSVNEAEMNVGGVVGRTEGGNTKIVKSYSRADLSVTLANTDANVGGIVGYLAQDSLVTGSAFVNGTLKGANVAGLVSVNFGEVFGSYSAGTIKGNNIAGFAVTNHATISNCYTISKLIGDNKKSSVNGFAKLIVEGSVIDHSFSAASLEGNGSKYAETESPFRLNKVYNFVVNIVKDFSYGDINNCIVTNYGKAEIQKPGATGLFGNGSWIAATEAQCKGEDGYSVFTEKAGFDSSIWNFEGQNCYPTLIGVVEIPPMIEE